MNDLKQDVKLDCGFCRGKGTINTELDAGNGFYIPTIIKCPECKGTGESIYQ